MSHDPLPPELVDMSKPYDRRFKRWEVLALTICLSAVLAALSVVLIWLFPGDLAKVALWPAEFEAKAGFSLSADQIVLFTAAVSGALGGTLHALSSVTFHRAKCDLTIKWFSWYIVRPLIGAALAIGFIVVIRGGFSGVSLTGTGTQPAAGSAEPVQTSGVLLSPYAVAAVGLMVGLFNSQAMSKLKKIAVALFDSEPESKPLPPPPDSTRTIEIQTPDVKAKVQHTDSAEDVEKARVEEQQRLLKEKYRLKPEPPPTDPGG